MSINFKKICLTLILLAGAATAFAQQLSVKGTVVDNAGQPVIGASIIEAGTQNGVISDLDGKFAISVKQGAMLNVSCISYVSQELQAAPNMNIVLQEDNELLDEVIVVGYGVQKKSALTGAIAKVETEALENRTVLSAEQALAGKTSGVQVVSTSGAPGSSSSVRIRGYSSNYASDPLYIVDGMKVGSISYIEADDIESIEVLKDAASAAIYGAEAGNGVILVTTKKGQKGSSKVSYSFQRTSQSLARLPEMMSVSEYLQYWDEAGLSKFSEYNVQNYYDGVTDTDWFDVAFENSIMQRHTVTFQQGTDKTSVYVSGTYLDNDGIVTGDSDRNRRVGLDLSIESKINKWITLGVNASGSYSITDSVSGVASSVSKMDPTFKPLYSYDELPSYMKNDLAADNQLLTNADGLYYGYSYFEPASDGYMNPLLNIARSSSRSDGQFVRGTGYVNITPFKGLVFTSRIGVNMSSSYSRSYSKAYYASTAAYQTNPNVSSYASTNAYMQWENFANYTASLGKHNFGLMAGMSYSDQRSNSISGSVNNITADDELFAYLNFQTSDATKSVSGISNNYRKLSYFGRANYNFAERYFIEFTMRADAADLSYLSKQARWGFFPAVSAGWVISNEDWFQKGDVMSFAKIRASWGQNGSLSSLGSYSYDSSISYGGFYPFSDSNVVSAAGPSSLGNDALKWETSEQLDFGADFRFLRDRLTITADYFIKKTEDLIMTGVYPSYTAGNSPSPTNTGNIENRGFEFDFSWKDRIGDFSYGLSGNIATLHNEVTYLDPTITRIDGVSMNYVSGFTAFEVGYPVWYFRGYRLEKIDPETGDPVIKDLNGDGERDDKDVECLGSAIPKATYGLTLNLGWKNWDFMVFANGSLGSSIFYNYRPKNSDGQNLVRTYYTERWTPTHTDATYPAPGTSKLVYFLNSDANIYSGNYMKIKQMQLGYTLPKKVLEASRIISSARAYLSLDDFFIFTKYPGMDPETATSGTTSSNGIDGGNYPVSRKVVLGVNISF